MSRKKKNGNQDTVQKVLLITRNYYEYVVTGNQFMEVITVTTNAARAIMLDTTTGKGR